MTRQNMASTEAKGKVFLDTALDYVRRGWAVFPLRPGEKAPLIRKADGGNGYEDATTDEAKIRDLWLLYSNANIGGRPCSAGIVVIDLDAGHDPELAAQLPPTYTVKSPHGRHLYYRSDQQFGNGRLDHHIDIRSKCGYVVLPPSRLADGSGYEVLTPGAEPVALPKWVSERLSAAREKLSTPDDGATWDNEANLSRARVYLAKTDPKSGCFDIMCVLTRDLGLSAEAAIEVFSEWNDWQAITTGDPWSHEWIENCARNARKYGHGDIGVYATLGPEAYQAYFDANPIEPPKFNWEAFAAPVSDLDKLRVSDWLSRDIPPRDWLLGEVLSTECRAMLFAATGLGKTHVAMAITGHIATGKDFLHWRITKSRRVLYIDGEMPQGLAKERLQDMIRRLGVEPENFFYLNTADFPDFQPLNTQVDGVYPGQQFIDELIDRLSIELVVFDNVQALTVGDQRDTEAWRVMLPWMRELSNKRVGQLWIHHANEQGGMYGDKTRAFQLDSVIRLQKVESDDELAFTLDFDTKARQRRPSNRDDYRTMTVRLKDDAWDYEPADGTGKIRPFDVGYTLQSQGVFYDAKIGKFAMTTRELAEAMLIRETGEQPTRMAVDARVQMLTRLIGKSEAYKAFVVRFGKPGISTLWGLDADQRSKYTSSVHSSDP